MKAYIASGYSPSTGKLVLTNVTEVPAGEGLYLVGEAGTYEVATTETDLLYSNLLKGVSVPTTIYPTDGNQTNFILANGTHGVGFYTLSEAGELAAGKCYLDVSPVSPSPAPSLIIGTNPTGIEEEAIKDFDLNGVWYTLDGRKIQGIPAQKGIYIKNGKKIIIK